MQDKIKKLQGEILRHKLLYYQGKPEISDFEYDQLEEDLKKIDPQNKVLDFIGHEVLSQNKIQHESKMLSLNKTYKLEDLISWQGSEPIVSTFKIDGSSCSLVYRNNKLFLAKTRGDGSFGENITPKVFFIENVPQEISKNFQGDFEVRGEIYCTEENFFKLSKKMLELGMDRPTSQRNIVAGLLGRKENINLASYLTFQAFELIGVNEITTEEKKFKTLKEMNFTTPDYFLNKTKEDLEKRLEEAKEFMSGGDYLIDGLVFTYNKISMHEELGSTAHHPRYKMAFKFQGEVKQTRIKSISWQVSRNGILTPVANVEPVELSGAMVSRVTLHNYGMVFQNQLKSGDIIEIVRSGEVIPKFLGVIKAANSNFEVPENCPSCSEKLFTEDIRLVCKNIYCPDKVKDEILNFIQKIGIENLSSKRLQDFIEAKLVTDIPSLYKITEESLLTIDKVKEKLAGKILKSINESKSCDLVTFLSSLGIQGGAFNKCEKVVLHGFNTIDKILSMTFEDLIQVESFAEKSAKDFVASLNSKKNIIEELIDLGFSIKEKEINFESNIAEKKFCITGTLSMKRSALEKLVKDNGGVVVSTVTKNTDFLITNDTESSSSKFKKAEKLNTPIISEEKFLEMLG